MSGISVAGVSMAKSGTSALFSTLRRKVDVILAVGAASSSGALLFGLPFSTISATLVFVGLLVRIQSLKLLATLRPSSAGGSSTSGAGAALTAVGETCAGLSADPVATTQRGPRHLGTEGWSR